MRKNTNTKITKKDLKSKVKRWKTISAVLGCICLLSGGYGVYSTINTAHADEIYAEDGSKMADIWLERIDDGRVILHANAANEEGMTSLYCRISCDPSFSSSEVFTFGALAQDVDTKATSYTNEVVALGYGETLYAEIDGVIYALQVPGEENVVETEEVAVPVATIQPVATPSATPTTQTTQATKAEETAVKKVDEQTKTSEKSSEKSTKKENETVINRTIINEVYRETEEKKETGFVYVSYVNEEGQKLASTLEIKGSIGLAYSAEEKSFDGYKLDKVDGNKTGKVQKDTQYVVFHYVSTQEEKPETPVEKETGFVYVSYVTEDGQNLAASLEISGVVGTAYTTEEKSFEGYEFISVEGNATGTISAEIVSVKYIYKKAEVAENPVEETGVVNVVYATEDGTTLATETLEGTVGSGYATEQKSFDGYEFMSVEGNIAGCFAKETVTVKYVYKAVEAEHVCDYVVIEHSEDTCTSDGYTIYACATCGDTYKEIIPAHGHTMEIYSVSEECIESHCKECGKVELVYSDVIDENDENESVNETVDEEAAVVVIEEADEESGEEN